MSEEQNLGEAGKELTVETIESPRPAPIKVFRINGYEWWAGESLKAIKVAYKDATGVDPDDPDEGFDDAHEISDAGMGRLLYFGDGEPHAASSTFREALQTMIAEGQTFPCFFAGTEY